MRLTEPDTYYQELLVAINQAHSRIVLAAMVILADGKTMPVFHAIQDALGRGVRVHILVDTFYRSPLAREGGQSVRQHRVIVTQTTRLFDQLRARGARISYFGSLGLNPFRRRCHVKVTVVDDLVFSFGGVNFTAGSFKSVDYMLSAQSSELAITLSDLVGRIASEEPPLQDTELQIDQHNALLFDGGAPGASIIYERVRQLTSQATKVVYVSQMVPSGALARTMRQINYRAFFNRPSQANIFLGMSLFVDGFIGGVKNMYKGSTFIHAKCMLFEMKDGTKALISGSHNFSWRGVAYGTQEIALYSTDEALWQSLYDFLTASVTK